MQGLHGVGLHGAAFHCSGVFGGGAGAGVLGAEMMPREEFNSATVVVGSTVAEGGFSAVLLAVAEAA